MWDVNMINSRVFQLCVWGLIWTMWDVNMIIRRLIAAWLDSFDLNYVGCELRWNVDYHSQWLCLIWTMWDVNMGDLRLRGFSKQVWSELCGMWTLHPFNNSLPHERGFDLNYVGCEHMARVEFRRARFSFDLNYVGCELRQEKTCLCLLCRFDLNYVGCEPVTFSHLVSCKHGFDLNYVGCELIDVRFKNFFL